MNSYERLHLSAPASGNSPDDDSRLVALTNGGDNRSFSVLVERHQNKVYRFILKHVNSQADARDLTQEAFLQAYRCLASFNGTARFSTWLIGIALNLARNHVNRAPKSIFVEYCEEDMPNITNVSDDPAHQHQQKRSLGVLARAIETLPADAREYMVLIGLDGHSYEEVAQMLAVPIGTVKSKMSRARQKLRQDLVSQGFFE